MSHWGPWSLLPGMFVWDCTLRLQSCTVWASFDMMAFTYEQSCIGLPCKCVMFLVIWIHSDIYLCTAWLWPRTALWDLHLLLDTSEASPRVIEPCVRVIESCPINAWNPRLGHLPTNGCPTSVWRPLVEGLQMKNIHMSSAWKDWVQCKAQPPWSNFWREVWSRRKLCS